MEVVVVGMVTAATPQQEEHTPAADRVLNTIGNHIQIILFK
jgi:hypothetical protein